MSLSLLMLSSLMSLSLLLTMPKCFTISYSMLFTNIFCSYTRTHFLNHVLYIFGEGNPNFL